MTIELIKTAIMEGKEYLFINKKSFKLPSPQTAGTNYQKESYAYMHAQRIYNSL